MMFFKLNIVYDILINNIKLCIILIDQLLKNTGLSIRRSKWLSMWFLIAITLPLLALATFEQGYINKITFTSVALPKVAETSMMAQWGEISCQFLSQGGSTAWVPEIFCNFYLIKSPKFVKNSTTTKATEKISAY